MKAELPEPQVRFSGEWIDLIVEGRWEYVVRKRCTGIVIIIAITDQQEVILTEQYRVPLGTSVLELPAGLVGDEAAFRNESLADAARRELLEETGYRAGEMTALSAGPISAGLCSEIVTFFLARQLQKEHAGGGDETEDITVHTVPLAGLEDFLQAARKRGLLTDPKIYAGLYLAQQHKAATSLATDS